MATTDEIISKAGGTRPSSSTRNKILLNPVQLRHSKKGYTTTGTAVGIEGERAGCVMVKDTRGGMWRPASEYDLST